MSTIYKLENIIKEYAWGSKTAFSALFNKSEPSENPQAELWMGAHPLASSIAIVGDERKSLADLIRENPKEILGTDAARNNDTLPFLLKIIAAEKPLSIQAHPEKHQAEAGFARENEARIPINSPNRVYRDSNHKPELLCALTPFWALCGFRPLSDIVRSFETLQIEKLKYETDIFSKNLSEEGLKSFYRFIMTLDDDTKREVISKAIGAGEPSNDRQKWMMNVRNEYPGDIGILSFLFLNLIELKPQEALYLPAQRLHTYLCGIGIEIMANSDNVVRGGITNKHVDVNELISILSFDSGEPEVLHANKIATHEDSYPCDAAEFVLSRIVLSKQEYKPESKKRNVEIIVVADGNGSIKDSANDIQIRLHRGDSCIIPAAVKDYVIEGKLTVYKATVPLRAHHLIIM